MPLVKRSEAAIFSSIYPKFLMYHYSELVVAGLYGVEKVGKVLKRFKSSVTICEVKLREFMRATR